MTDRPSCQVPAIRAHASYRWIIMHSNAASVSTWQTHHDAGRVTDLYGGFAHGKAEFHALLNKDMIRLMFVLEGCRPRPDLEAKMDWGNKGRVLVLEKA